MRCCSLVAVVVAAAAAAIVFRNNVRCWYLVFMVNPLGVGFARCCLLRAEGSHLMQRRKWPQHTRPTQDASSDVMFARIAAYVLNYALVTLYAD